MGRPTTGLRPAGVMSWRSMRLFTWLALLVTPRMAFSSVMVTGWR